MVFEFPTTLLRIMHPVDQPVFLHFKPHNSRKPVSDISFSIRLNVQVTLIVHDLMSIIGRATNGFVEIENSSRHIDHYTIFNYYQSMGFLHTLDS
jgi:hypothetical protein